MSVKFDKQFNLILLSFFSMYEQCMNNARIVIVIVYYLCENCINHLLTILRIRKGNTSSHLQNYNLIFN